MTKYIVVLTIDRRAPGTDVTDLYAPDQLQELVRFGYLEEMPDDEKRPQPARRSDRRKDGG